MKALVWGKPVILYNIYKLHHFYYIFYESISMGQTKII